MERAGQDGGSRLGTIGVVGAGVIGRGIAQHLAETNHDVILVDLSQDILEQARGEIASTLRVQRLYRKAAAVSASPDETLRRIQLATDLSKLSAAELVVENVTEKWSAKAPVYERLDALCQPQCIFAANTSCIPITRIASATRRPDRVIGIHFMNPVPMKPVVEVIRGRHTSEETVQRTRAFLAQQGKEGIVVNDSPGFVTNRVLMLTINEAIYTLFEQVAQPKEIDRLFTTCFGHKMGPLETADLIGLDTILYSLEVLYEEFCDSKYRPCPLLKRMVDAGWIGRKAGKGFYAYPGHG